MGKRQKLWAKTARLNLLLELGMYCKKCGREDNLTFDCIEARGDSHHRLDTERRICFYRREHKAGNIQVLCKDCNEKKAVAERAKSWVEYDNTPF